MKKWRINRRWSFGYTLWMPGGAVVYGHYATVSEAMSVVEIVVKQEKQRRKYERGLRLYRD